MTLIEYHIRDTVKSTLRGINAKTTTNQNVPGHKIMYCRHRHRERIYNSGQSLVLDMLPYCMLRFLIHHFTATSCSLFLPCDALLARYMMSPCVRPSVCLFVTSWHIFHHYRKEAQLLQSDLMTCYISKFVLCFMKYGSYKGFKQQKWPSGSFKGIGSGAIW